jgi:hypothetical protein
VFAVIMLISMPLSAQDTGEDEGDGTITFEGVIEGVITASAPRAAYFFDGLRGEVVAIRLESTSGDLDPVLLVVNESGAVVTSRDDSLGNRDIRIDALTIPRSGRYYVIVGRFGFELGSTAGDYALAIERIGVSGESGSALRYGDSVINNINNMQPQAYYSFQAAEGDIIDVLMERNSGNLDPYLQIVNERSEVIADNDDELGSNSLDAAIQGLIIEESGTYIVVASRYGEAAGTSSGLFILTLREAENSGLGNAVQTALALEYGTPAEGEITNQNFLKYYRFEARQDDIISIRMSRTSNTLDAYLALTDANLIELINNDDSAGSQNAAIENYRIPQDGIYYVLATRLDREAGTTSGGFRLELQGLGNAFDGVPEGMLRIAYGSTTAGRIDGLNTEWTYAFFGQEGDAITLSVNRTDGNLDPVMALLDAEQNQLVADDDSGEGQNSRIARYELPRRGIYYVRVNRFSGLDGDPNTEGGFILVLARIAR